MSLSDQDVAPPELSGLLVPAGYKYFVPPGPGYKDFKYSTKSFFSGSVKLNFLKSL
jgi:hypothetical protein